ncbi:MAG: DUF1501 domain-containing protein [Saprospiraceae bacterium]|nr:DUF1501 domain-containing protein [Saprospiraceae bacterium]MDW8482936.1 DUF1501 domain-containing protein [Saprospiraceae bacterium]
MKRRQFLKIAGVTPFVVNGHPVRAFANSRMARILAACKDIEDRVLVLIQLKGGNDGLNTLVPIAQYDTYAKLRPVIKIPDKGPERFIRLDNTLPLADQVGLHPVMKGFKELYDRGWLNIVQGVGYENINQSHFKGTDLWLSGGDGTVEGSRINSGWMGRALAAMYPEVKGMPTPEMPHPLGIQIGDPYPSLGFHTETEHQNYINLYGQDPQGFYSLVQTVGGAPLLNVPESEYGDELRYIMGVEASLNQYAQYITQAFKNGSNSLSSYPDYGLADQLKTVARLIKGGCKTKIYLCSMGGFDTHGTQIPPEGVVIHGRHATLLRILSESVKAFYDDLDGLGLADKVVSCTFSEFGRTAKENGSAGTDHGTLAPMFVFGKALSGGIHGTNVNLSNLTSDYQLQGQQFDYRQVFTTLLQDWLGASDYVLEQTMFQGYTKLPIISSSYVVSPDCYISVGVFDTRPEARSVHLMPNPAQYRVQVSFVSESSGEALVSLHSLGGSLLRAHRMLVENGLNFCHLDVAAVPDGTYFVRVENLRTGQAEVAKLHVVH